MRFTATLRDLTTEAFGGTVLGILLKYEASLAPDEALSTAFRQQAELLYSFGQRFKSSSLDYATVIVGEIIDHFLAVEGHYPDDRSELSGADAASGAALCGEFGSMHRVGSMEACIAWGAGGHASRGEHGSMHPVVSVGGARLCQAHAHTSRRHRRLPPDDGSRRFASHRSPRSALALSD